MTAAALLLAFCVTAAQAQVMEIGAGGAVTTYDGPAVFTDAGATPIRQHVPRPARYRTPTEQRAALQRAATAAALSPDLIAAVAWRESAGRLHAVSRAGAIGEMQLMPGTARALGVDPADGDQNLRGGATYLNQLMRRYDGDLVRALAAYNSGPGAVDRYHGVPPYRETQAYVAAVLDRLSQVAVAAPADRPVR